MNHVMHECMRLENQGEFAWPNECNGKCHPNHRITLINAIKLNKSRFIVVDMEDIENLLDGKAKN